MTTTRRIVVATGLVAGVATLTVAGAPFVRLAYRQPGLHVAIDTATGVVGLLVAYLVYGRFRTTGLSTDFVLAAALVLAGLADLFLLALPAAGIEGGAQTFSAWAPASGRILVALGFCYVAIVPARSWRPTPRHGLLVFAFPAAVTGVLALAFALASPSIPAGLDPSVVEAGRRPELGAHVAIEGLQLAVMALFGVATIGFLRRSEATGDEFLGWLAVSSVLAAAARLNYFLFPSLYSEWVSTGDILRFASHAVLLFAAFREIAGYWRRMAEMAVVEERRRLARDLHDGLAHELAIITNQARAIASDGDATRADDIVRTSERAFDESRMAIQALASPAGETLDEAIARTAEDLGRRLGVEVHFDLAVVRADVATTGALVRITREAIVNAARHGRASRVELVLGDEQGITLRLIDDGEGFEPADGEGGSGIGLTSMRERAAGLGGRCDVTSSPGQGATVEVWVPRS